MKDQVQDALEKGLINADEKERALHDEVLSSFQVLTSNQNFNFQHENSINVCNQGIF